MSDTARENSGSETPGLVLHHARLYDRAAGFIMVEPAGIAESTALSRWLELACAYVNLLPPKVERAER